MKSSSVTFPQSYVSPHPPSTTSSVLRAIIAREGYGGLLAGIVPRIAKIAPACAIMISTYEAAKLALAVDDRDDDDAMTPT